MLRYLAKVTVEPAITHGVADHVGSLRPDGLADIVLWKPAYFGAKPEWVFKGGFPAWGPLGEGNATVERSEPTRYQADWGADANVAPRLAVTFVSGRCRPDGAGLAAWDATGAHPGAGCRGLTRAILVRNRATAPIEIDPTDGRVTP